MFGDNHLNCKVIQYPLLRILNKESPVVFQGDKAMVERLLQNGASLEQVDHNGYCPIMPCLSNGMSISLLRFIVELMEEQRVSYDISGWDYLRQAFPWQG